MSKQYTLRSVPPSIDQALRKQAKLEDKSLNEVALEALSRGLDLSPTPMKYHDLDHLIGTWEEDPAFDEAIASFSQVDQEAWK
jgi:hypothetical protein